MDEERLSEQSSLLSTGHTEHHMANPRVVSDIILVLSSKEK